MLQNAVPLRKSAPGPPNSSDENVSCTAPATEKASLQILCKCPTLAMVFGLQKPHVLLTFAKVHNPLRLPHETTSERPKVVRTPSTFWLRNVLRATTACTFSTSQLFEKWSEPLVFSTFWLQNVLRATTARTFSTSQLPKVVREWCALYILTWKCASRHNGVHFFNISTSKSGPRMVCFVHFDFEMCFAPQWRALFHLSSGEPTFRPSGATNHWKNTVFRDFPTFSRIWASFFWLFLFSDLSHLSSTFLFSLTLPVSAFHLSILSEVWLLNFLRP